MGLQQTPPQGHHLFRRQQPTRQPVAADVYARAIARGHDHPHAVRVLARAWIRVIYRCWIDGVPYDPNKHGGAGKLREPATAA